MEALGQPEDIPPVPPGRWREMEGVLARASRPRRILPWAAAAAVLLGLAWLAPRKPLQAPPAAPRQDAVYLAPDCCLIPAKGARLVREGERLRLESGALEWINRGWTTVRLETPLGVLEGEAVEARISLSAPSKSALWIREALAAEQALTVQVSEGQLSLGTSTIPAGKEARFGGGRVQWRDVPRRPAQPGWTGTVSGFLPVEGTAYELELSPGSPSTSVGLAFPAEGRVRLWHLGSVGTGWKRLRIAARGGWAEGWVDGRLVLSTRRAVRSLQDAPKGVGIYVWGSAEIRGLKTEPPP